MPRISDASSARMIRLVRRPDGAVEARARSRRLLTTEADRPVEQTGHEPLEPDGHLEQPAPQVRGNAVDHRGRHEGLADSSVRAPARPCAAEEVLDRNRQVVVGVHQPVVRGDDAMPVAVRVIAGRDVEAVLALDERRHRRRRGAVHPDLAVPVEGHERPLRVDFRVDDREIDRVSFGDRGPVVPPTPHRGDRADPYAGFLDLRQVNHAGRSST